MNNASIVLANVHTIVNNVSGQHFTQRALEACLGLAPLSKVQSTLAEMTKTCNCAAGCDGFDWT